MGEYGGRNFKTSGGKPAWLSHKGDRGIPPSMPAKGGSKSGIEFLGKKGDKGMSTSKGVSSKPAPRD